MELFGHAQIYQNPATCAATDKRRKDQKPMATPMQNGNPAQPPAASPVEMPANLNSGSNQYSMIGKSIAIKGEITASDPVYVYGTIEGRINAPSHRVTIGKEGRVKADISAREVVIMGDVFGNLNAGERVEIRCDGSLMGDLSTTRIFIEEGAVLSGSIDVHKPTKKEKAEAREEQGEPELDRKGVVSFPVPELAEEIAS
ncbi:MAG TPA: polymer-forming cytoskeletal protein [Terracidiphilus sp.]|nr:polymer-forming cytoskeletal protein [Terracidiphilus sp.]